MTSLYASLRRMAAIIRKELLVIFCGRTARLMVIVPPLAQIVIFGWAATMEVRNVAFAVLDEDRGRWSAEMVHSLLGSPTFVRCIRAADMEEAGEAILAEKALLALRFDQNFSRDIEAGRPATFQLVLDGRRANAAQIAANYVAAVAESLAATTPLAAQRAKTGVRSETIDIRCWFNPNLEFQWFFLPNLIGMLSFMLGLVITGLSVAREREAATFDQMLVSPASPVEIALAKLVPGVLIGLAHCTIFVVLTVFGFGVPFDGSLLLLYAAMILFSLASGGIGLMISSLSQTQQQAFLGSFTVGVPCILISGSLTPIVNMPPFLQALAQINPITHFQMLCQGSFIRDITPDAAAMCMLKIVLICVVSVSVAVFMFRRRA